MELWHGSSKIVRTPSLGFCRPHNDYGPGFYCTDEPELAKEWACTAASGGFANRYELDCRGLKLLDLSSSGFTVLNWLAVLVTNRVFQPPTALAAEAIHFLKEGFLPDLGDADIVRGYRADDSYFSFARAFVSNQISVAQLSEAMHLGKLGTQVMLKSEAAFRSMRFLGYEAAPYDVYYPRRTQRDGDARAAFRLLSSRFDRDGLYMADFMREGVTNDDERIPRC